MFCLFWYRKNNSNAALYVYVVNWFLVHGNCVLSQIITERTLKTGQQAEVPTF